MGAVDELKRHIKQLDTILDPVKVHKEVLTSMLAVTEDRIFTKGLDSRGSGIGKYSEEYAKFRAKKNLGGSKKVVLQFSQQMRNDFSVIIGPDGKGLGFKNNKNFDKSFFVENTYNKDIFSHTPSEERLITKLYGAIVKRHLN